MKRTKYKNVLEDSKGAVISLKPNFKKGALVMWAIRPFSLFCQGSPQKL